MFDCPVCDHTILISSNKIIEGKWCPYCVNLKLCENDECKHRFTNSFASHPKSKYWHSKNKKTPRQITIATTLKCWFKCEENHEFDAIIYNVTGNNSWCPKCVGAFFLKFLIEVYNY